MALPPYFDPSQTNGVGMGVGNPSVPVPAQDPFGYTSGFPFSTTPGYGANLSSGGFALPDPSTGSRGGGMAAARVPGQAPESDLYQGISGSWIRDTMGYAPRIPTAPDFNSGSPGQG